MTWPTVSVVTTNLDAGTDSPATARANLLDAVQKLNEFIGESASGAGFVARNGTNTMTAPLREPARVAIATAATVNLQTAASRIVSLTGTTTVTAVTLGDGQWAIGIAAAAFQLTNSATLVVQGAANYTTAAGDVLLFTGEPSSVVRVSIMRANGAPVGVASQAQAEAGTDNATAMTPLRTAQAIRAQNITLGTSQAATGTSVDFTGIPSWAKRVTVLFDGVSTNGTSQIVIYIGDSGGLETTGYNSGAAFGPGGGQFSNSGAGFILEPATALSAAGQRWGSMVIERLTGNTWVARMNMYSSAQGIAVYGGGAKTLSDVLDRVRISTLGGTDTFDAGTINITWE